MRKPSPSDPELISLGEAAARAGRSYSWAWSKAAVGRLEKQQDAAGRTMVTARRVAAAIARDSAQRRSRSTPGAYLRLTIDNTK